MSCPSRHSGVTKVLLTVSLTRAVPSRRARATFTSARDDHLCARSQGVRATDRKAQLRLRARCRRPVAAGKDVKLVTAAIARDGGLRLGDRPPGPASATA